MSKSQTFFFFCLLFIGGIFLCSFLYFSQFLILSFLIPAIILISVLWRRKSAIIIGFCILFFLLGIFRFQTAEEKINSLPEFLGNRSIVGVVCNNPETSDKSAKLKIKINNASFNVLVFTNRYPEYKYGDELKITGEFKKPLSEGKFNYEEYLKKDNIIAISSFPKIELIKTGSGSIVKKILFSFENKFEATARNFISPPQEGLLEALAFGNEENISKEWKDKFNATGLRHIAAVSGMNITIISFLIISFALNMGLARRQALLFSSFLIFTYILMIGAPASIGASKLHYRV